MELLESVLLYASLSPLFMASCHAVKACIGDAVGPWEGFGDGSLLAATFELRLPSAVVGVFLLALGVDPQATAPTIVAAITSVNVKIRFKSFSPYKVDH